MTDRDIDSETSLKAEKIALVRARFDRYRQSRALGPRLPEVRDADQEREAPSPRRR